MASNKTPSDNQKMIEDVRAEMEEVSFMGSLKGTVYDKIKAVIGYQITRWLVKTMLSIGPRVFFLFFTRYSTAPGLLEELQKVEGCGNIPLTLPNTEYIPGYKLVDRTWNYERSALRFIRLEGGGWILANVSSYKILGVPSSYVVVPFWHRPLWEKLASQRVLRMGPRRSTTIRERRETSAESDRYPPYRGRSVPNLRRIDELPINSKVRESVWEHVNLLKKLWLSDAIEDRVISRNIAFFGVPGTGKSTVAYAMAREFRDVASLFPTKCTVAELRRFAEDLPVFTVVIADEADKSPMWRASDKDPVDLPIVDQQNQPAGVSDVLAYMSGPLAPQSCTTVVISNYPDKIDHRTYREGRVRAELHFTEVDDAGIRFYLENWHKLEVPKHYRFVEDKTTTQIFAMEEKLDDPTRLMEALRVDNTSGESNV